MKKQGEKSFQMRTKNTTEVEKEDDIFFPGSGGNLETLNIQMETLLSSFT